MIKCTILNSVAISQHGLFGTEWTRALVRIKISLWISWHDITRAQLLLCLLPSRFNPFCTLCDHTFKIHRLLHPIVFHLPHWDSNFLDLILLLNILRYWGWTCGVQQSQWPLATVGISLTIFYTRISTIQKGNWFAWRDILTLGTFRGYRANVWGILEFSQKIHPSVQTGAKITLMRSHSGLRKGPLFACGLIVAANLILR